MAPCHGQNRSIDLPGPVVARSAMASSGDAEVLGPTPSRGASEKQPRQESPGPVGSSIAPPPPPPSLHRQVTSLTASPAQGHMPRVPGDGFGSRSGCVREAYGRTDGCFSLPLPRPPPFTPPQTQRTSISEEIKQVEIATLFSCSSAPASVCSVGPGGDPKKAEEISPGESAKERRPPSAQRPPPSGHAPSGFPTEGFRACHQGDGPAGDGGAA